MARILLAACLLAFGLKASLADTQRVALIIGMNKYAYSLPLNNPVPDAKAISSALRANGFTVFEHYDLNRADMLDALEAFKEHANKATLALVYYAGHGMEIEGKNVLAPIDMEIACDTRKARRAVELEKLFEAVGNAPQQVVLLDACRNDPFPQCPTRSTRAGAGFRSFGGLGGDDRSLLIANATLSGQLAADGDPGDHSPFASALLRRLQANPRMYLRDLLDLTAQDVRVASRGTQIPEITTRGGAPRACLALSGCGDAAVSQGVLTDEGALAEVRKLLDQLGFAADRTRSEGSGALEQAVRKFQISAGLPADGQITPSLLAVLRATRQMAALPRPERPDIGAGGITLGPGEHPIGSTFKDCDVCPEMVAVPGGNFQMGSAAAERGRQAGEDLHAVRISRPFAVGKFEITFDEWEVCALEGGCNNYKPEDSGWGRGRRPAIYISWDDAKAYIAWLRQKTGKPYRLLSEAEWEFVARAGTTTRYATGDNITTAQANYDATAVSGSKKRGTYEGTTVEVGAFPPNPFGLHDVHGNVFEWVEDCWNKSHAGAPEDGSPRGGDCQRRVTKGGAWYYEADYLRSAMRASYPKGTRLNVVGFRVARNLE